MEAAADTRKAVEAVNRERKLAQTAAAASLVGVEARWLEAVAKNREIEAACEALEARVGDVQAGLPAQCGPLRGVVSARVTHSSGEAARAVASEYTASDRVKPEGITV